jgi:hypothetical protein
MIKEPLCFFIMLCPVLGSIFGHSVIISRMKNEELLSKAAANPEAKAR